MTNRNQKKIMTNRNQKKISRIGTKKLNKKNKFFWVEFENMKVM